MKTTKASQIQKSSRKSQSISYKNVDNKILKDMIFAADLDDDQRVSKDEFMRVMRKMKLI